MASQQASIEAGAADGGETIIVGSLLLRETHGTKIWDEVEETPKAAARVRA